MTKSKDLRDVVIAHYQNGKNAPEISTMLANKVHFIDGYGDLIKVVWLMHVKSSGRRRTGTTKRVIKLIERRVRSQSTRKDWRTMAKDFLSVRFFWKVNHKVMEHFLLE